MKVPGGWEQVWHPLWASSLGVEGHREDVGFLEWQVGGDSKEATP